MQTLFSWEAKLFLSTPSREAKFFFPLFPSFLLFLTIYHYPPLFLTSSRITSLKRLTFLAIKLLHLNTLPSSPSFQYNLLPTNFIFRMIIPFILEGSFHSLTPLFFKWTPYFGSGLTKNYLVWEINVLSEFDTDWPIRLVLGVWFVNILDTIWATKFID